MGDPVIGANADRIARLALERRLPTARQPRSARRRASWPCYGANFEEYVPARRRLRGPDPERREAGGPAGRAADALRADRQREDREGARHHDPAVARCARRIGWLSDRACASSTRSRDPSLRALAGLLSPLIAALATLVIGFVLFTALGKDPLAAFHAFFIKPVDSAYGVSELLLKASPLMLIATGLAVGYRANVWNIGAEGQLLLGAIAGGGLALAFEASDSRAAAAGDDRRRRARRHGVGAIPAWLRTRFNANEILVSLMLVYVATSLLSWLVHGPWRDPEGFNFPQSKLFHDAALLPPLVEGLRVNAGLLRRARASIAAGYVFMQRSLAGFQMRVAGLAPAAANYAGISAKRTIWLSMLVGGACAGIAGVQEAAGPVGQLLPTLSPGYGFAAIIVAFVGRLHPVGILLASLLMSLLYLGGESAQLNLALPSAVTGLFQGTLLFFLLAADVFIHFRLRRVRTVRAPAPLGDATAGGRLMDQFAQLVTLTLAAGTPLVFAALGELVTEKSGVLNLGVEGMMLVGAVTAFAVAATTKSPWLGVAAGMVAGALVSMIFAVLTLTLMANQVASGLALSLFGLGLSAFAGLPFVSVVIEGIPPLSIAGLSDLPVIGKLLFAHNPLVYLSLLLFALVQLLPVSHARGTRAARGRRVAAVGACDRLSGGRDPLRRRAVRRRVLGTRGRLSRGRVHAAVGRGHDRRTRLDRAGARRVRDVETVARAGRRVPVRRRDARAVPGAGARASTSRRSSCRCCRTSPRSSCWRSSRATRRRSGSTPRRRWAGRSTRADPSRTIRPRRAIIRQEIS